MADLSVHSPLKKLKLEMCSGALSKAQAVVKIDMLKVARAINKEGLPSGVFAEITNVNSTTRASQLKIFASKYRTLPATSLRLVFQSVSSVEQLIDPDNGFLELAKATKVLEMYFDTVENLNKISKNLSAINRQFEKLIL